MNEQQDYLRRKLIEQIRETQQTVAGQMMTGTGIKDYPEYRELVGQVKALQWVLAWIPAIVSEANKGD